MTTQSTTQRSGESPPISDTSAHSALHSVRARFPDRLPHLRAFESCALVDYSLHPNPGDHMLFLAALLWLGRQCRPERIYLAHRFNYARHELKRVAGDGPVFCVGGGNFGDLWSNPQRFREEVVADCPGNPVVLLPQSVLFRHPEALARAQAVFNSHPQRTIMLRDPVSLAYVQQHFTATTVLTPDQSVLLADVIAARPSNAGAGAFFLIRGLADPEASAELASVYHVAAHLPRGGWTCMGHSGWVSAFGAWLRPGTRPTEQDMAGMPAELRALAERVHRPHYVVRSCRLVQESLQQLEPYRLVITDRFHGHMLSAIRGIPHVVIGNNHHKIESHWVHWMSRVPGSTFVRTADELARVLAQVDAGR